MRALPQHQQTEQEPPVPAPRRSYRGNPLRHRAGFDPKDAVIVLNGSLGLPEGVPLEIIGYYDSPAEGMHIYLDVPSKAKHFRLAAESGRQSDEVPLRVLPDYLTELCLRDCMDSLEYVPAYDVEPQMCVSHRAPQEEDSVIPLHDKKTGQFLLFNVA